MDGRTGGVHGNVGVQIGDHNTLNITVAERGAGHVVVGSPPIAPSRLYGRDAECRLLQQHLSAGRHGEIDARGALDAFTVERLRRLKHEHEDRIRHVTGLGRS